MSTRRDFIALLGGATAAWPLAARAQQSSRMKRIAMVSPAEKIGDMGVNGAPFYHMAFEELSRLGYVEGQNLVVERYSGEGRTEHYADLARMEDVLRASDLDWTIVRPPRLTSKPVTGRYRTAYGQNLRRGLFVSRADVAHYMLSILDQPETFRQTIGIAS